MRRTIRAHPGEVTLLPIGPLTNVALLFAGTDPEIPSLLGGLMLMGGSYWSGVRDYEEWNAILDPHATAMVYRAAVSPHRSVGLDVTTQVRLSHEEVRRRFSQGLLRPVMDFAEVIFRGTGHGHWVMTLHDPLAATCLFDAEICDFTRGQVSVDLEESPGKTGWQEIPSLLGGLMLRARTRWPRRWTWSASSRTTSGRWGRCSGPHPPAPSVPPLTTGALGGNPSGRKGEDFAVDRVRWCPSLGEGEKHVHSIK